MDAISYSKARQNLAKTLDRVCENHEPLLINRQRGDSVVVMSLADFESLEETAYLLRSPANAARLISAIHNLESGKGDEHQLGE